MIFSINNIMKKSSIFIAAALSLAIGGCTAHQQIDSTRMERKPISISRVDSLYALSEEAVKEGDYNIAEGLLEEILIKNGYKQENKVLFNYGMARMCLERSNEPSQDRIKNRHLALGYFKKVVELTENDVEFNAYRLKSDAWA